MTVIYKQPGTDECYRKDPRARPSSRENSGFDFWSVHYLSVYDLGVLIPSQPSVRVYYFGGKESTENTLPVDDKWLLIFTRKNSPF